MIGDGENHDHAHPHKDLKADVINKAVEHKHKEESDDSDEDEEVVKNVISAKGRFASFLNVKNARNSMLSTGKAKEQDKSMYRSSMILAKSFAHRNGSTNQDFNFFVNPNNVNADEEDKVYFIYFT